MKIMKIQYTLQAGFVDRNKQNIAKVMQDLRSLNNAGIRYSAYVLEDGKTFLHFVMFKDDEASKQIGTLESFKHFQAELKASSPEVPPQFTNLALVGSSFELFA
jgi:hypothetical protein